MEKGLSFHKLDLHVHTPASACFKKGQKNNVTEKDIIQKAIDRRLSAIAITDHNTGAWIDKVKEEGNRKGLVVFPGVEISAAGGDTGTTHIIGIFDISKERKDIENLLGKLDIPADKYGAKDAFSPKLPSEVIDMISKRGGLAVAAHANSTHGLLRWRGEPRTATVQNPRLMAAEGTDFDDEGKANNGKRVCDLLDGSDPVYKVRKAVYQASDNLDPATGEHCIEGIGTRCSYFKLDEVSLEGLRQCFADDRVRIRNDLPQEDFPVIESLNISGGFFRNKTLVFNRGLNAVLGGKGVGKSLIIEFLRFALHQQSGMKAIIDDSNGKLSDKLGMLEKLKLVFRCENGDRYQLTRTYDDGANEIVCENTDTLEPYAGAIRELFPVLAYSQTEIIEIARDKNAQLNLIDNFINANEFKRKAREVSKDLSKNDKKIADAIKSISELREIHSELSEKQTELKAVMKALEHKTFTEYKSWENRSKDFKNQVDYHDDLINEISDALEAIKTEVAPVDLDPKITDRSLNAAAKKAKGSHALVIDSFQKIIKAIEKNKKTSSDKYVKWLERFKKIEEKYQEFITEKGEKKVLEGQRKKLQKAIDELKEQQQGHKAKSDKIDELRKARDTLLDELDKCNSDFFNERQTAFKQIENQSDAKLQLDIAHATNKDRFMGALVDICKGSRIRKENFASVSENMTPRAFINHVIDNKIADIARISKITKDNAKNICEWLLLRDELDKVLSIQHKAYPEDVPTIKFKKQDRRYYELNQLSVGQKCSALVIIALSKGKMPIIIDQPEDSLDIKSVWEDVGQKLRSGKDRRQFILTTHNANIAVASDSDKFHILDSDADEAKVISDGAIERDDVRTEVIKHLEGGPDPYNLRKRKYNLRDSMD